MTLMTGVIMAAENSALPSQEYIIFQNILKLKTVILNCNNISKSTILMKFCSDKCI